MTALTTAEIEAFLLSELPRLTPAGRRQMVRMLRERTQDQLGVIRAMLGDKDAKAATGGDLPDGDAVEALMRQGLDALVPLFEGQAAHVVFRATSAMLMSVCMSCGRGNAEAQVNLLNDASKALATFASLRLIESSKAETEEPEKS